MQDIPYAAPPVGDLRFHPPVSLSDSRWSCVRDGRRSEEKICPQVLRLSRTRSEGVRDISIDDTDNDGWQININFTLSSGLVNGGLHELSDEDCLYLNVYVPDTEADMRNMFDE